MECVDLIRTLFIDKCKDSFVILLARVKEISFPKRGLVYLSLELLHSKQQYNVQRRKCTTQPDLNVFSNETHFVCR